ncbi:MAG: hypothetical protein COV50_06240 [Flavobacteriales bacterium CG11_big_fil_rev_8_21_14_0_20_35_7]|nr:MAG: hypothetical protein COV50_06240 [Flavobacteriales bacterium CG11_big_fil_rev_8_21_14_0_20_35_7]
MDDITLPHESDDDRLFIRSVGDKDDVDFHKHAIEDDEEVDLGLSAARSMVGAEAGAMVKIKFAKFVQLVASHSYIDIVDKNAEEDVIVSGNLLTDLANAHDQARERRMPLMFLAGLVIGIVLTYIISK